MPLLKSHNNWPGHLSLFLVRLLDFTLYQVVYRKMSGCWLNCNRLPYLWQILLIQILLRFLSYLPQLNTHHGAWKERTSHWCTKYIQKFLKNREVTTDTYGALSH